MASSQTLLLYVGPTPENLAEVPSALTQRPQWVLWRGADRIDKDTGAIVGLDKIPIDPQTLRHADTTDPTTWGTFAQCVAALPVALEQWERENPGAYRGGGLGFVFSDTDPYTGIDLDHCVDPVTGMIEPWAQAHIDALASYSEITPSSTGLHILVEGALPPTGRKHGAVEMYEWARFFTMTGWHLEGTPSTIAAHQEALHEVHGRVFGPQAITRADGTTACYCPPCDYLATLMPNGACPGCSTLPLGAPASTPARPPAPAPILDDTTLLAKARAAKNAAKFTALWAGDTSLHDDDDSSADMALCWQLAFWTQDPAQLDRLFRQSGLMRTKWDATRGDSTYGARTVQEALARQTEHYTPGGGASLLVGAVQQAQAGPNGQALAAALQWGSAATLTFIVNEKGRPRAIVANVLAILEEDPRWRGVLGYNEFMDEVMLLQAPPWGPSSGAPWLPRPLTDADGSEANAWIQRQQPYGLYGATALVNEALDAYAARHPYHPVRDFLTEAALAWDGVPRIGDARTPTWLHAYCHVAESAYSQAIAPKILLGAVARVMRPGCKVDTMPIMESKQGLLKSTVWRLLASDAWFNDSLGDLRSKDARQDLRGVWIVEFSDLSRIRGAEVEHIKAFLSQTFDRYRPSYGRRAKTFLRQNVFVGSTNEAHYFKDVTGNRRFWPFPLTVKCDIDALQRDRVHLWGEAVLRYRQRERWYLTEAEEVLASGEQQARVEVDAWEECVLGFIAAYSLTQQGAVIVGKGALDAVPSAWIFERALGLTEKKDWTRDTATRVARIMQKHGWTRRTVRDPETKTAAHGYRLTPV